MVMRSASVSCMHEKCFFQFARESMMWKLQAKFLAGIEEKWLSGTASFCLFRV